LPFGICSDPSPSCLCDGFAARHVEARSSNKEQPCAQVLYQIGANILV
jgi:hypothetical protein